MSYDIYLRDPVTAETIKCDSRHHIVGGTYQVGGASELWINVTYNYGKVYGRSFPDGAGIDWIDGKTGAEAIPVLRGIADRLGNDVDDDYWKPTEGNAKRALLGLLAFATMRPDGVFGVCS